MSKHSKIRRRDVKSYQVQGVTYTYHRDTGIRLPNDPSKWATAIEKIQTNQKTKSEAFQRFGFALENILIREVTPRHTPDMIAFSIRQTIHFTLNARSGDTLLYHSGDLANDITRDELLRDRQGYLLMAAGFGVVHLRQQRVRPSWSHYFATRSDESLVGIPKHAIHGDITPDEYRALNAINERQSALSVTRCIRDALGINDRAASDKRNDLIRQGWLTNGRPPELTEIGLEMLT